MPHIGLTLRDLAFLQGFVPDRTDPDIWGWWSVDLSTLAESPSYKFHTLGDLSSYTLDQTDRTDSRNLIPIAVGQEPYVTRSDNKGNMVANSSTIVGWSKPVTVTINDATHFTCTAQNDRVTVPEPTARYDFNVTYTFKVKLRAVTGNTALQFYHLNSPTGTSTNVVVTNTLAEYSCTFLGNDNDYIHLGIRDANAAGFGQIEIVDPQVTAASWDTDYIETTGVPQLPGVNGKRAILCHHWGDYAMMTPLTTVTALPQPFTIYMLFKTRSRKALGRIWSGRDPVYSAFASHEGVSPSIRIATNAPLTTLDNPGGPTDQELCVFTAVYNGASSESRKNKNAAVTGSLTNVTTNKGFSFGTDIADLNSANILFLEAIIRSVADDTATQNLYIQYLANKSGLII